MPKYIKSAVLNSGKELATGLDEAFKKIPNYTHVLRTLNHEPTQKKLRELYAVRSHAGPFMNEVWNSDINKIIDEYEIALGLQSQ